MWLINHIFYFILFFQVLFETIPVYGDIVFFMLDLTWQAARKTMEEELVRVTKSLNALALRVEESDRYVAVALSLFSPLHPDLSPVPPGRGAH
jgi:hypothetical protein